MRRARQTPTLKSDIAAAVSELNRQKSCTRDPRVTAIIVKSADAADWFAGGKSLAEQSSRATADIHITEGTNTRTRRRPISRHCSSAWASCSAPLHNESYAHVDEVGGDAYGLAVSPRNAATIAGKLEVAPQKAA